jgi:hypothetical protein
MVRDTSRLAFLPLDSLADADAEADILDVEEIGTNLVDGLWCAQLSDRTWLASVAMCTSGSSHCFDWGPAGWQVCRGVPHISVGHWTGM